MFAHLGSSNHAFGLLRSTWTQFVDGLDNFDLRVGL